MGPGWRSGAGVGCHPSIPVDHPTHRDFTFSRIQYQSDRREAGGQGWYTDYPTADQNLMIRLSELTTTSVGFDDRAYPDHVVVTLTDPRIFNYPFLFMSDVGTLYLDGDEAARLRDYLLKGGFLWVDDFWGPYAWDQWVGEIRKVLPAAEFPIVDIGMDHPIHRVMFAVDEIPQIPSIQHFRRSGYSTTSERGGNSAEVHFRAITDEHDRILVLMEPQYGHRRWMGARRRGLRVLLPLLGQRLRDRDQHRHPRDDTLTPT